MTFWPEAIGESAELVQVVEFCGFYSFLLVLEENTLSISCAAYAGKEMEVLAKVLFGHLLGTGFWKVLTHTSISAVPGLGLPCTTAHRLH